MKVTQQEIVDGLRNADKEGRQELADFVRDLITIIEQHGIAPPDVDANGCSTHPKARHGFARQASHSEGEYVCECAGFDPYDAGYQDGLHAAWDANGGLLPDGMVLVRKDLVEFLHGAEQFGGVWFGEKHPNHVGSYWWRKFLAAAPEVKP